MLGFGFCDFGVLCLVYIYLISIYVFNCIYLFNVVMDRGCLFLEVNIFEFLKY